MKGKSNKHLGYSKLNTGGRGKKDKVARKSTGAEAIMGKEEKKRKGLVECLVEAFSFIELKLMR
jgi:hypothetical protein